MKQRCFRRTAAVVDFQTLARFSVRGVVTLKCQKYAQIFVIIANPRDDVEFATETLGTTANFMRISICFFLVPTAQLFVKTILSPP